MPILLSESASEIWAGTSLQHLRDTAVPGNPTVALDLLPSGPATTAYWDGHQRPPCSHCPKLVALLDSLEFFCNSTDSRAVPALRELAVLPGPVSFASSLGRYTLIGSRVSVLRCERVRIGKRSLSQSRCIPSNAPLKQYGDLQVSLRPASRGCMRSDISGEPASLVFTHTVSRASSERHEMGTLGLQETARRLRECVRACCRRV